MQCLTGLAYSDIIKLDFEKVELRNGQYVLNDERAKTGVDFTVVLLPEVLDILKRYGYKLPKFSNQQYNMRLKLVADAAGIDKPIASHWGRRTFGMYLLNNGFSMEVVAKVLGTSPSGRPKRRMQRYLTNLWSRLSESLQKKKNKIIRYLSEGYADNCAYPSVPFVG